MKTIQKYSVVILLASSLISLSASASSINPMMGATSEPKLTVIGDQKMADRLNEIKSMNLGELSRKERKELKREVKSIQKAQTTGNGGVYLSVGAIIIIILLLILIL